MPFSLNLASARVAVIGLGYVGLPLAAALGRHFPTVGFDVNCERVRQLSVGHDATGEVDAATLVASERLMLSSDRHDLSECNVFIVAVPTPIDGGRQPDLRPLINASELVGEVIRPGAVVVYESTVYPGATEDDCIPVVERLSGLRFNEDFYGAYSPERVNPGDKNRPLTKIVKVTSGSTPEVAEFVDQLYAKIIEAGTFRAQSIKVAEAAKLIENVQRDVNIALINELSIVFSHLGIDTTAVLDAASTKWNFTRLSPGLVGGHCIGVDPYYMLHKSTAAGYVPDIIRNARQINDGMAKHAVGLMIRAMAKGGLVIGNSRVLVVGFTFKENCPDIRNTKVNDLVHELTDYGIEVDVYDPWADSSQVQEEYGVMLEDSLPSEGDYAGVIIAVAHNEVVRAGAPTYRNLLRPGGILFDMKAVFSADESDVRL